MEIIELNGIKNLISIPGNEEWYIGCHNSTYSIAEYENAFNKGKNPCSDRIIIIHFPDGKVIEPVIARKGQYLGWPCMSKDIIYFLLIDFNEKEVMVLSYNTMNTKLVTEIKIGLDMIHNISDLFLYPLSPILAEHEDSGLFHVYWPESIFFHVEESEIFEMCKNNKLYFSKSDEQNNYNDEVIIRDLKTGKVIEKYDGRIMIMPDGELWNIK